MTRPALLLLLLSSAAAGPAPAAAEPDVPAEYKRFFVHYVDRRSMLEKSLNLIGFTGQDAGRSFALIAGVSQYPNMPITDRELKPAAEDLRKLREYLPRYEFFDEIVVLENRDMNYENLQFFLQTYFPRRLEKFPRSRFLFAYSGHGMSDEATGYLLKHTARSLGDKDNSISLKIVRVLFDEVVEKGHHVLGLINACYSGNFVKRSFGGRQYLPEHAGAHVITAGGSGELTWHDPEIGSGSIFFEKLFAGLDGRADLFPKRDDGRSGDGMIVVDELATYLRQEIQIFTDQRQNPQAGDISKHGSRGSFFFLDRRRQVESEVLPDWKPERKTAYGVESEKAVLEGRKKLQTQDYGSASTAFQSGAAQGNPEAMLRLGMMYAAGQGVQQDLDQAVAWLSKSAAAGNGTAMYNLGIMYAQGHGVAPDLPQAAAWLRRAADAGVAPAMASLAVLYEEGRGVEQSYDQAARLYRDAAEAGVSSAMTGLGHLYQIGRGVPKELRQAHRWYRKGAEAGNAAAMVSLGMLYLRGEGVRQDVFQAEQWFRKAADGGDANAMTGLGAMYENGQGVPRDLEQARDWYRKAAALGHAWAAQRLAELKDQ